MTVDRIIRLLEDAVAELAAGKTLSRDEYVEAIVAAVRILRETAEDAI